MISVKRELTDTRARVVGAVAQQNKNQTGIRLHADLDQQPVDSRNADGCFSRSRRTTLQPLRRVLNIPRARKFRVDALFECR